MAPVTKTLGLLDNGVLLTCTVATSMMARIALPHYRDLLGYSGLDATARLVIVEPLCHSWHISDEPELSEAGSFTLSNCSRESLVSPNTMV